MGSSEFIRSTWDYFRIASPSELRKEYINNNENRQRTTKQLNNKSKLVRLLDVFDWYPSHYSEYERRYLRKVDIGVVVFLGFTFFAKTLDLLNTSNAYVSGMKEELGLNGNELNYFSTCYNIAYSFFQLPMILLIQNEAYARYLLLACELVWGMCTFACSTITNAEQLYAIKFVIGMSEAVSFPGSYVIMSTWYTPEEYVQRAGLYNAFSCLGSTASGLLQTACKKYLNGVLGKSSWRWQFVLDGAITISIVLYGFFLFPGTPNTTKRMGFLTEDDLVFARKRKQEKRPVFNVHNKGIWHQVIRSWKTYLLIVLWISHHQYNYSSDLTLYIKSRVPDLYSPSAPTNLAALAGLVAAIFAFLVPNLGVVYGKFVVYNSVFVISYFCLIVLIIWDVPEKTKLLAYLLEHVFASGLAPSFFSWAGILCSDNSLKKQITLALMNTFAYATQAWSVPLQWNIKYSPQFTSGFRISLVFLIICHITFVSISFLEKYDRFDAIHVRTRGKPYHDSDIEYHADGTLKGLLQVTSTLDYSSTDSEEQ